MKKSSKIALIQLLIFACMAFDPRALACPPAQGGDKAGGPPQQGAPVAGTQQGPPSAVQPPPPAGGNVVSVSTSAPTPGSPDLAQTANPVSPNPPAIKATREPAEAKVEKIVVAPYVPKNWSCGCSNVKKTCDKGFVFSSMADATAYAKRTCGESCIPVCSGRTR